MNESRMGLENTCLEYLFLVCFGFLLAFFVFGCVAWILREIVIRSQAIQYDNEAVDLWNAATCHGIELEGRAIEQCWGCSSFKADVYCRILDYARGLNLTVLAKPRPSCCSEMNYQNGYCLEDLDAVHRWQKRYSVGSTFRCWFNPDHSTMVALENNGASDWPASERAGLAGYCIGLFGLLLICFCCCLELQLCNRTGRHVLDLCNRTGRHVLEHCTPSPRGGNNESSHSHANTRATGDRFADSVIGDSLEQLLDKFEACGTAMYGQTLLYALWDQVKSKTEDEVLICKRLRVSELRRMVVEKKEVFGNEAWSRRCKVSRIFPCTGA